MDKQDGQIAEEITLFLQAVNEGHAGATNDLLSAVYDEMRAMAHGRMRREAAGHTLQTTALAHEAYLRLIRSKTARWENRRHFFGAVARSMRQILIDHARRKMAEKNGGGERPLPLDDVQIGIEGSQELLALNEALDKLADELPRQAQVVVYRHFMGMSVAQTSDLLEVSRRTVDGDWEFAKAWLHRELDH